VNHRVGVAGERQKTLKGLRLGHEDLGATALELGAVVREVGKRVVRDRDAEHRGFAVQTFNQR
jgi:hypothetical protein